MTQLHIVYKKHITVCGYKL